MRVFIEWERRECKPEWGLFGIGLISLVAFLF